MTTLVGRNYARALFELASESRSEAGMEEGLLAARAALFDDRETRAFLANRLIGRTVKKKLVRDVFGSAVDERLLVLLYLLVDRGRTTLLGEIAEEYQRLLRLARGVRKVTLDTAFPLGPEETDRVTRALESLLQARVQMQERVRRSLVGGVVAESEGREMELSVERRLRDLADRLRREGARRGVRPSPGSDPE